MMCRNNQLFQYWCKTYLGVGVALHVRPGRDEAVEATQALGRAEVELRGHVSSGRVGGSKG